MPYSYYPSNVDMIWGAYWHIPDEYEKFDTLIILKKAIFKLFLILAVSQSIYRHPKYFQNIPHQM